MIKPESMSVFQSALRQSFIRSSPPVKILLLVLIMVIFLLISSFVSVLLAIPLFRLSLADIIQYVAAPDAAHVALIKYFQVVQTIFLFLLPALLAAWLFSENTAQYLVAGQIPNQITLFLVACSMVSAIPLMNALAAWNADMKLPVWMHGVEEKIRTMEDNAGKLTDLFLNGKKGSDLVVNLIMIGILPALGEELLFRGVLQRLLIEWTHNKHAGIWIAAFVFSFIHFQFYGFVPRLLLGLYFGYLLIWTSNLWIPITAHFVNNGFAVVVYHFSNAGMGESPMDKWGTEPGNYYMLYISLMVTLLIITFVYRLEKNRPASA